MVLAKPPPGLGGGVTGFAGQFCFGPVVGSDLGLAEMGSCCAFDPGIDQPQSQIGQQVAHHNHEG